MALGVTDLLWRLLEHLDPVVGDCLRILLASLFILFNVGVLILSEEASDYDAHPNLTLPKSRRLLKPNCW